MSGEEPAHLPIRTFKTRWKMRRPSLRKRRGVVGVSADPEADRLPIAESDTLSQERCRRETVVFGLRLIEGIDYRLVEDAMSKEWTHSLSRLMDQGFLEEHADRIRLTDWGRRYADTVAVELL